LGWGGLLGLVEGVADAGLGNNIFGFRLVRLYLLAQVPDIDAHVIQVVNIFPAPDSLQKLPVSKNTASILQQQSQQAELDGGQPNPLAVD
jgi:hypothetical protein